MKPQSIQMFDRLYLGALALGVLNSAFFFEDMMAMLEADPAVAEAGFGAGFFIATMAMGIAISLLLWFFTSPKRSVIAKWILVVLTAIGIVQVPFSLQDLPTPQIVTTLIITAMQLGAVIFLFRSDAKAWFDKDAVDTETFE